MLLRIRTRYVRPRCERGLPLFRIRRPRLQPLGLVEPRRVPIERPEVRDRKFAVERVNLSGRAAPVRQVPISRSIRMPRRQSRRKGARCPPAARASRAPCIRPRRVLPGQGNLHLERRRKTVRNTAGRNNP
jgi:hypothetical protein